MSKAQHVLAWGSSRLGLNTSPLRKNPDLQTWQPYKPAGTAYTLASQMEAKDLSHRVAYDSI